MPDLLVEEPSIRGAYIGPSKNWVIRTYGAATFHNAVATLAEEHQLQFTQEIVSVNWYALKHWTAVLDAVRDTVKKTTGEDAKTFDTRNLSESIGTTMRTVYRLMFNVISPTTVVAKVTPLFQKVYSHGVYQVMENKPGECVIRFHDAPIEMRSELTRSFPIAVTWMLETAGQRILSLGVKETLGGRMFTHDMQVRYEPRKR